MSNPSGPAPAHRSVSSIRPGASTTGAPNSPHTPLRTISSNFSSPSALRAEEECVVFELGARFLRAGFAGDAVPKAVIDFGPEEQRRAGDYRRWEVDYDKSKTLDTQGASWGEQYELWKPDLRGLDLGLVGDKIDRAVREAFTKYLLSDSRPRRMALILPSTLPLPLLSTILDTLFTNFQPPNISLMSAPVLTAVASGLRSALVVDIGWAETAVTALYEYREVQCRRSIRATKMLGEALQKVIAEALDPEVLPEDLIETKEEERAVSLPDFDECEDILARMAWCKPIVKLMKDTQTQGLAPVVEEDEFRSSMRSMNLDDKEDAPSVSIPLSSTKPPKTLDIPFSSLSEPCERALFATGKELHDLDDEELPLHVLVYQSLLQLPVDARSICMSRIIFVGGASNIPGLKSRVIDEVAQLIEKKAWDPVQGHAIQRLKNNPALQRSRSRQPGPAEVLPGDPTLPPAPIAAFVEQEHDPIEEQLRREASKGKPPIESGHLRVIDSLGAWSGGSLLMQLKIPAVSVVDRDQWLQHGISGASKAGEVSVGSRQSMGPGAFKSTGADRTSWTLGLWA